jgi:UDP-3-O-[3-hydroxymyristoyl] glucosamine N-acyltransferase
MITRTVSEIAEFCDAVVEGEGSRPVVGPAALEDAGPDEVSFLGNSRYAAALETTRAAAVLVARDIVCSREDLTLLRCDDPSRAFTRVIEAFRAPEPRPEPGVHPTAVVDPSAELGKGVAIGPLCAVGSGACLGDGVVLHPGVVIGSDVRIGDETVLYPRAVLYRGVEVGSGCTIHAGVILGSDGFGFDPSPTGWSKIPQCGTVVVEDDVEIGSNTTIDRGRFGATRIGRGAKIDNLVHVAHNVVVGPGALLIAQVGIAGSAKVGKGAILAGQVGVNGHVTIGEGARVAGQSGVTKDLEGGRDYSGNPVRLRARLLRIQASMSRLPDLIEQVKDLEARLGSMEGVAKMEEEER